VQEHKLSFLGCGPTLARMMMRYGTVDISKYDRSSLRVRLTSVAKNIVSTTSMIEVAIVTSMIVNPSSGRGRPRNSGAGLNMSSHRGHRP